MKHERHERLSTGVPGLDSILGTGLLPGRSYLVSGQPGTGKTTLGLHFLAAGAPEDGVLVSLGEAERHIRDDAASIGLDLDEIQVIDLSPAREGEGASTYTLLEPWEAEQPDIRAHIEAAFPAGPPRRVFIDALSQFQLLAPDAYQFRKQVMNLLGYLTAAGATVVFTAEQDSPADQDLRYLGDGILQLDWREDGRALSVMKFRASRFAEGRHTLRLGGEGMRVYERLVPEEHRRQFSYDALASGVPALDRLIGGGLEQGTITVISGPTGVGKTSLGAQFMHEAARRGERSTIFSFEESLATLRHRCEQVGIPLDEMMQRDTLAVVEVEPLTLTPDEFAWRVREEVEERGARMVMIDSLAGYRQSVRGEDVGPHAHALCRYMANMGVTVLLINESASITGGELHVTEHGISYLSDAALLLRYIEIDGEIRKTIGMLKKRTSDFEKTLREFEVTPQGIVVGEPLNNLRGILRGTPEIIEGQGGRFA